MTPRKTITGFLLAFGALSIGYLVVTSLRAAKQWHPPSAVAAAGRVPAHSQDLSAKVIAYYFHVTVRYPTCRAIEPSSKGVIHQRFAREMSLGQVECGLVNVQHPENRNFVQDYQLFTKSLVLVLVKNGRQEEYKVLNDTWEPVGDKAAMQAYVEKEIRGHLRKL